MRVQQPRIRVLEQMLRASSAEPIIMPIKDLCVIITSWSGALIIAVGCPLNRVCY